MTHDEDRDLWAEERQTDADAARKERFAVWMTSLRDTLRRAQKPDRGTDTPPEARR